MEGFNGALESGVGAFSYELTIRAAFLGVEEEAAGAHQWPAVYVDVAVGRDGVDVDAGSPGCAGLVRVGVSEGDVYAGILLVLEEVADQPGQCGVGADGELSHPPAISELSR